MGPALPSRSQRVWTRTGILDAGVPFYAYVIAEIDFIVFASVARLVDGISMALNTSRVSVCLCCDGL